jgi:hypothetical protein
VFHSQPVKLCSFMARDISPWILSFPVRNAI